MRKRDTSVRSLRGQLLFAEARGDTVTLDCLLCAAENDTSGPATFVVTFPPGDRSPGRATQLLDQWADDLALVTVRITDGRGGAQVEIVSGSTRLVLEPEEAALG